MSFQYEGQKCPVCHAYLFEEDDIVCCPECGAPHHRDCYANIGHCALADFHGTEQQYDCTPKTEPVDSAAKNFADDGTVKCQMCGEEYESQAKSCPRCGAPNFGQMNRFVAFDFLGGVPADMDLGEGVTADEAKRFVMANTTRYIPKFAEMKEGKKSSWNLLAFLFPCGWFCSRKMYRNGILAGAVQIALLMLISPFGEVIAENGGRASVAQLVSLVQKNSLLAIFAAVGGLLCLAVMLLCGIFGDYFYRGHVIEKVGQIKTESEDEDEDYRRFGGVSLIGMLLGIFAVSNLPSLLLLLI